MAPDLTVPEALQPVLEELTKLEPLFHAAAGEATPEMFEKLVAPEFWEIGASGRRYTRAFSLRVLKERTRVPTGEEWDTSEYHISEIAPQTCLLTYTLTQPGRTTLRATLWQKRGDIWQALFHQGTPVQDVAINYKTLAPEK